MPTASPIRRAEPLAAILCVLLGCVSPEAQLQRAQRAHSAGDDARALALYDQASRSEDAAVGGRALLEAARIHWPGDGESAEALCETAVERFTGSDEAAQCLQLIIDVRRQRLDHWGAIDAMRELLAQRPGDPACEQVRHDLANTYIQLDDLGQALIEFTAQLEQFPDGALASAALLGVARCHDLAGDCGVAVEVYRRVSERFAGSPDAYEAMVGEGGCLEALGDLDAAERRYREALAHHPNPDVVRRRLDELTKARMHRNPIPSY